MLIHILYMETKTKDTYILLVDGNCALCHGFAKWIIKNKKEDSNIRLASLQSVGLNEPESVILYKNGKFYFASDALIELRKCLKIKAVFWISLLQMLPRVIRNYLYSWVAHFRYRCFGKVSEKCYIEDIGISKIWLAELEVKKMIFVQDILFQKETSKPSNSSERKG